MLMQIENLNIIGRMNEWSWMNDWVVLMLICNINVNKPNALLMMMEKCFYPEQQLNRCQTNEQFHETITICICVCVCFRHQHN